MYYIAFNSKFMSYLNLEFVSGRDKHSIFKDSSLKQVISSHCLNSPRGKPRVHGSFAQSDKRAGPGNGSLEGTSPALPTSSLLYFLGSMQCTGNWTKQRLACNGTLNGHNHRIWVGHGGWRGRTADPAPSVPQEGSSRWDSLLWPLERRVEAKKQYGTMNHLFPLKCVLITNFNFLTKWDVYFFCPENNFQT